jgi:hypothetical protein
MFCRKMGFFNGKETVGAFAFNAKSRHYNYERFCHRASSRYDNPRKGFLHLYDSTPYMINAGHVALHIPSDANSKPDVNIIIGQKPGWKVVELEIIKELSQPGIMSLFHVDVNSGLQKKNYQTDVALQNPSNQSITFPPSSTAIVGVNEIQPVPGGG